MNKSTRGPAKADPAPGTRNEIVPRPDDYLFEIDNPESVRTKKDSEVYLRHFTKRLGLVFDELSSTDAGKNLLNLLREYVYENHLPIAWYDENRKKQTSRRNLFRLYSVGLLVFLPIAVAAVPIALRYFKLPFTGADVAAVVTAVLTGLLGLQKTIGTWMDQRQLVGIFWQASADLKENVYTLEGNWEDRHCSPDNSDPQFLADLEAGIALARKITRTERDAYFDTFKAPTLDVSAALKSARSAAAGLWSGFAADTVDQERERLTQVAVTQESLTAKRLKVRNLRAEVENIKELIEQIPTGDDTTKTAYQTRLIKQQLELATAEAAAGS